MILSYDLLKVEMLYFSKHEHITLYSTKANEQAWHTMEKLNQSTMPYLVCSIVQVVYQVNHMFLLEYLLCTMSTTFVHRLSIVMFVITYILLSHDKIKSLF